MSGPEQDVGRPRRLRPILAHVAQGVALVILLLGPCALLEYWAERDVRLIPYLQQGYRYRLEAKKLLFSAGEVPDHHRDRHIHERGRPECRIDPRLSR